MKPVSELRAKQLSGFALVCASRAAIIGCAVCALLFASTATRAVAQRASAANRKDLRVYFVDVEGGQSTLFVTPSGDSLLVDTGWPGNNGRDANRIVQAAENAGIRKITSVVITHYHTDHVGGVPQLVARIPVGVFVDHGPLRETNDMPTVQGHTAYEKVLARGNYKHVLAKPGTVLSVDGMLAEVVSADGNVIAKPLPGAGESNASACAATPKYPVDQTENRRSVGMVITFGKLRILDLGDLTHDEEVKLMCPSNKLGRIDILVVSHHGWDQSSSPALVWGIRPRVAIMDNGEKKGGSPSVWDTIKKSPGLQDLWQLHYSDEGGKARNVPARYIANLDGSTDGNYIELTASPSGSFSVLNSRTGKSKDYPEQSAMTEQAPQVTTAAPVDTHGGLSIVSPVHGVDFSGYLRGVVSAVRRQWLDQMPDQALTGQPGKVSVRFIIDKDGSIRTASVERSSGNKALDDAALNAIKQAGSFGPLPADYAGPSIDLRFVFAYNVPAGRS